MPIQTIPEKSRTMLHFGTGDIHITDAKMAVEDGSHHLVVFHQMEPHPIGSSAPELHGTACDDFSVGMTFTRPESIDAVVNVLTEFKAKHFPLATKQPEGAGDVFAYQYADETPRERIYREALERIAGNESETNRQRADGIAISALEKGRHAPRPDEQRVREAVHKVVWDNSQWDGRIGGRFVSADPNHLTNAIMSALRPHLAGQVAGGEDTELINWVATTRPNIFCICTWDGQTAQPRDHTPPNGFAWEINYMVYGDDLRVAIRAAMRPEPEQGQGGEP